MKVNELAALVGGLSEPSKMPGYAYGIPAQKCILGSILAKKKGSVCNSCYALKGMYVFPVVKNAQARRLESISRPEWVAWMAELIGKKYARKVGDERVFRWHDSGDLQSTEHLSKIVAIAKLLPDIRFWLPTRERKIVAQWVLENGSFPSNLVVRISMQMVGQEAIGGPQAFPQSTVGAGKGFQCPARSQGNECKNCRACWDAEVPSVNYSLH
jgi:protein gp88